MTRWRLLRTGAGPGAWNMACDTALLAAADAGSAASGPPAPPTIRLFGWSPPAISLGHHQPDPSPAEAARMRARGLEWVRRPTGGRAVYHGAPDEELTYSVVAPVGAPELGGGLAQSYRRIHELIAAALSDLGVEATLAPRSPTGADARTRASGPASRRACFAASVAWEIAVDGRKLVGSAQRRGRRAILQHGSIPLAGDQSLLSEIWPGCLEPERVTNVSSEVGRRVGFDELASALVAAFENALDVELRPEALSPHEEREIHALLDEPALA